MSGKSGTLTCWKGSDTPAPLSPPSKPLSSWIAFVDQNTSEMQIGWGVARSDRLPALYRSGGDGTRRGNRHGPSVYRERYLIVDTDMSMRFCTIMTTKPLIDWWQAIIRRMWYRGSPAAVLFQRLKGEPHE